MNDQNRPDPDRPIGAVGTPAELRTVESALDRLAHAERLSAPDGLEGRVLGASAPRLSLRAGGRPASWAMWLRVAAAVAIACGAGTAWWTLRPSAPPGAPVASAESPSVAELEQQMEAWLSVASWTVADSGGDGSTGLPSDDVARDFWPSIDDDLYGDSL